jgi:hypothetical protein
MTAFLKLQCLGCGKVIDAPAAPAAGARCGACGQPLCALGKPVSAGKRKPPCPATRRPDCLWSERLRSWAQPAWMLLGLLGLALVGGEVCLLEAGRRDGTERSANAAVLRNIEAAQERLSHRQWHEAAVLLHEALATEDATNLEEARRLLAQLRLVHSAALLEAAEAAIQAKDTNQALNLLETYLLDPEATEREQATRLRSDIELATSSAKAAELLRQLPDPALLAFAAGGRLPALDRVGDETLREVYAATLHAQLAAEQARRAELRRQQEEVARRAQEALAKREARIRATAAFHELEAFVTATRQSLTPTAADPRLVAALMQELNITNPAEQAKALAELTGRGPGADTLATRIAQERAALKEAFRAYRDFAPADRQRFEQLVDQEMDRLLREVERPREPMGK